MQIVKRSLLLPAFIVFGFAATVSAQTNATPDNLALVTGMYEAVGKGDVPAFLAGMDANIEWNEAENFPYADGNPYIGPDAIVKGVFQRIGADWEYWTLSDLAFHETKDNMVIVTGHYNAKHKVTGKIIKAQFTHMWTIKNGKGIKFQQYADTYQVNKAMEK